MLELRGDRSQAEVALAAGLTYWRYARMEEGETSLPAECLGQLAAAYGVPLTTLLEKLGLATAHTTDWRAALLEVGYSDDEVTALFAKATSLDADARAGWLAYQVHRRRSTPKHGGASRMKQHHMASSAG
jgi:transcriptional regulator with XRE-family HTH domain